MHLHWKGPLVSMMAPASVRPMHTKGLQYADQPYLNLPLINCHCLTVPPDLALVLQGYREAYKPQPAFAVATRML